MYNNEVLFCYELHTNMTMLNLFIFTTVNGTTQAVNITTRPATTVPVPDNVSVIMQ